MFKAVRRLMEWLAIARDPVAYARSLGVQIGNNCRLLGLTPNTFGSEPYLVSLGDHVTVASGVDFVTHDGGVWVFREEFPNIDVFGAISVGSNVFIGMNTLILPGVCIGDNCVIGAGSVVTRDVPSCTVVAGIPAKQIRTLDEYREKVALVVTNLRDLPSDEKGSEILRRFGRTSGEKTR